MGLTYQHIKILALAVLTACSISWSKLVDKLFTFFQHIREKSGRGDDDVKRMVPQLDIPSKHTYSFIFFSFHLGCNIFLSNITQTRLQVLILILAWNWCSSQCTTFHSLSDFIASNLPRSIRLFTALPSCCPMCRMPFTNLVRMWTHSLVPRPKTMVIPTSFYITL